MQLMWSPISVDCSPDPFPLQAVTATVWPEVALSPGASDHASLVGTQGAPGPARCGQAAAGASRASCPPRPAPGRGVRLAPPPHIALVHPLYQSIAPHAQQRIGQALAHAERIPHLRRREALRMVLEQRDDAPPHGAPRVTWWRLGKGGRLVDEGHGAASLLGHPGGCAGGGQGGGAGRGGAGSAGGPGRAWRSSGRYAPGSPLPL